MTYSQVWWPILGIRALHLPIQVNTHPEQWAAIYAVLAVGGSVPCSSAPPHCGIEVGESAVQSLPPPTIPAGPRLELTTLWLWVWISTIRPRLPPIIKSNHFYCHINTGHVPWWVKLLIMCSRQCRNNLNVDSTYLQTYTDDNVQYTHTYTQYTHCTILDTYSSQHTLYTLCTHSTLCTHIYTVICEGATDYT